MANGIHRDYRACEIEREKGRGRKRDRERGREKLGRKRTSSAVSKYIQTKHKPTTSRCALDKSDFQKQVDIYKMGLFLHSEQNTDN